MKIIKDITRIKKKYHHPNILHSIYHNIISIYILIELYENFFDILMVRNFKPNTSNYRAIQSP